MIRALVTLAVGISATVVAVAAPPETSESLPDLRWRGAVDGAAARRRTMTAEALAAFAPPAGTHRVIVTLAAPPDRGALAAAGVRLLAPLGAGSWFARVDAGLADAPAAGLVSIEVIPRAAKLHPMLRGGATPAWATSAPGRAVVQTLFHRDVTRAQAAAAVGSVGGTVVTSLRTANALVVELPATAIDDLADRDEVQWVEPPLPRFVGANAENRAQTQVDAVQAAPAGDDAGPQYGLDGSGVVIMLYDTGVAAAGHPDFGDRVTPRDGDIATNHSTHVAGTIAGDGSASNGFFAGMAPGATIESYGLQFGFNEDYPTIFLYQNPGDVENDYADALRHGAVLANNSLGTSTSFADAFPCEINGDYGLMAHVIDSIAGGALGAPMRIIWSNGNERGSPVCGDEYYTVSPPSGAKNVIAVGAVNANDGSVTNFTSWGPMDDGRLRPDLVAPGCQSGGDQGVTSTWGDGGYAIICGTSMAAPTVTGIAALLLEDFRERFPGRPDLAPATLKALLVHAATDLETPGPDYQTGHGLVQAKDTIDLMRAGAFVEGTVGQGQEWTATIAVTGPTARLEATLAWTDPPATPNVEGALVNDLDVVVEGPGGLFFPWTLDPRDPAAPAVRTGPDRLNNLERVTVDAPAPGIYIVRVTGTDVPEGPQAFSLAATPALAAISIDLPEGPPVAVAPDQPQIVAATVRAVGQSIVAGSVHLHHRLDDGPFEIVEMTPVGDGRYEALLPPLPCGGALDIAITAEGALSGLAGLPSGAPANALALPVAAERVHFADDFETDLGWTVTESDTLLTGAWDRGVPVGDGLRGDPVHDADGSGACYLTMNEAGNTDVDLGSTTLISPALDVAADAPVLSYARWFATTWGSAPFQDVMTVEVSDDDGATWRTLEIAGPGGADAVGGWRFRSFDLSTLPEFALNDMFRVRFTADDAFPGSIVEAGVDAVRLASFGCDDGVETCAGDLDGSGTVDIDDLVAVVLGWGPCFLGSHGCADLDGSGGVDAADIMVVIDRWGACP